MVKAKNIVIGITGTMTSGKGALRYFLINRGFKSIRFTRPILEEGEKRGEDMSDRQNWIEIVADMRQESGESVLAEMAEKKIQDDERYVVCPIRHPADIKYLKERYNALIIFVDAPFETRYKRTMMKELGSGLTREEFKKKDDFEIEPTGEKKDFYPNISECRELADEIIMSEGSLNALNEMLDKILRKYNIPDLVDTEAYDDVDI